MKKRRIRVIYYSQSGTLRKVLGSFLEPLSKSYDVIWYPIYSKKPFPFPWTWKRFFDVLCPAIASDEIGCSCENIEVVDDDIVLLGFQPWFLSLSLPMQSFINSPLFANLVSKRDVILFTCYRNTGAIVRQAVANKVEGNGGVIIAELEIFDHSKDFLSSIRFANWFFTGRNNPFDGMEKSIKEASTILSNTLSTKLKYRIQNKEITITKEKMILDIFQKWTRFIRPNNKVIECRLLLFQIWIVFSLIFISPLINFIIRTSKKRNYE
ncbi:hypothetical protein [Porphyromonas circumdentaria]|uniref:hypothetical protein n=1 Tax=Porphyromonas circumdentaria TaxID=29524 RepID=UPI0026DC3CFE|nr:hypothetical protein [Porphyromonas circumdentaria]MDO4721765.1 hypothetical protein [Porphyromonas circumdentaria]